MVNERQYWNDENGLGIEVGEIKPGEYISLLINHNAALYGIPNEYHHVTEEFITSIPDNQGLISLLNSIESRSQWRRSEIISEVFSIIHHGSWYDPEDLTDSGNEIFKMFE